MNIDQRYRQAAAAAVTYTDVDPKPRTLVIGHGRPAFERAKAALQTWVPQRSIGARVHPADAAVELGATVLLRLPLGITAPTRIVDVVDEPDRFGYAYGTLPGHPESGEERFEIRLHPDGAVTATIAVDASPATLLARLAGPVAMALQTAALRRYLYSLRKAAQCQ